MRIFNKFKGTRGWLWLYERELRLASMTNRTEAERRLRILIFWERYGMGAAREAFSISPRTLYRWRQALRGGGGKLESLDKKRTVPRTRRRRDTPEVVAARVIALREAHPRIGKDKIHALLVRGGYLGSVSTVGRVIGDLKKAGRVDAPVQLSLSARTGRLIEKKQRKRKKKLRRPKGYRVLEVDTVVRFIDGVKRYILTAVDTEKRQAFAAAYTNHGSASAADFLRKAITVLPDCPDAIQTDNGSEFALHFERALAERGITHFHIYPRSPKMNSHVERFNRTLDEEFLRSHRGLLRDDVAAFNEKLIDWLLWYNSERPHYALGQVPPFQYMMLSLSATECQMWWTHTGV